MGCGRPVGWEAFIGGVVAPWFAVIDEGDGLEGGRGFRDRGEDGRIVLDFADDDGVGELEAVGGTGGGGGWVEPCAAAFRGSSAESVGLFLAIDEGGAVGREEEEFFAVGRGESEFCGGNHEEAAGFDGAGGQSELPGRVRSSGDEEATGADG